jgi:hypothetical protein
MRDLIGIVSGLALPWATGAFWVMALRRNDGNRTWVHAAGYGYLIGALATTLVMRLLSAVGIAWSFAAIALPMMAIAVAGYALARPLPTPAAQWALAARERAALEAPLRAVFWLCLALTALRLAGLALGVAWRPLLGWDAWSQWGTKARVWFEFGRIVPFVAPETWLREGDPMAYMDMHSHYPGTVPLLEVWTNVCIGRWDESLMNAPWPALAAALGCAFFAQARSAGLGAPKAMAFTFLLLSLPFLDIHVALAGTADIFMAAAYGMAAMALWQWGRTRRRSDLALAVLMALACCAIKMEGRIWALTLVPAATVAVNRRVGGGVVIALAASAALYLLLGPTEVTVLGYVLRTRFTNVSLPLAQHLFVMDNWHLLWYVAIAVIASCRRRLLLPEMLPSTVTMLGAFGLVTVVFYFSSASQGVENESMVNRLPLQMVPALAFYLLLLVRASPPDGAAAIAPASSVTSA